MKESIRQTKPNSGLSSDYDNKKFSIMMAQSAVDSNNINFIKINQINNNFNTPVKPIDSNIKSNQKEIKSTKDNNSNSINNAIITNNNINNNNNTNTNKLLVSSAISNNNSLHITVSKNNNSNNNNNNNYNAFELQNTNKQNNIIPDKQGKFSEADFLDNNQDINIDLEEVSLNINEKKNSEGINPKKLKIPSTKNSNKKSTKNKQRKNQLKVLSSDLQFNNQTNQSYEHFSWEENNSLTDYGRNLFNSVRTNQEYIKRVQTLTNRINKLTEHETEIQRKVKLMKDQTLREEKIRVQKLRDREILIAKIKELDISLESHKIRVLQNKNKRQNELLSVKSQVMDQNKKKYEVMKNDRELIDTLTNQVKLHYRNLNSFKCLKIRESLSKSKITRENDRKDKEQVARKRLIKRFKSQELIHEDLVDKICKLEEVEANCVKSLNQTIRSKAFEIQNFRNQLSKQNDKELLKVKKIIKSKLDTLTKKTIGSIEEEKIKLNTSAKEISQLNTSNLKNTFKCFYDGRKFKASGESSKMSSVSKKKNGGKCSYKNSKNILLDNNNNNSNYLNNSSIIKKNSSGEIPKKKELKKGSNNNSKAGNHLGKDEIKVKIPKEATKQYTKEKSNNKIKIEDYSNNSFANSKLSGENNHNKNNKKDDVNKSQSQSSSILNQSKNNPKQTGKNNDNNKKHIQKQQINNDKLVLDNLKIIGMPKGLLKYGSKILKN